MQGSGTSSEIADTRAPTWVVKIGQQLGATEQRGCLIFCCFYGVFFLIGEHLGNDLRRVSLDVLRGLRLALRSISQRPRPLASTRRKPAMTHIFQLAASALLIACLSGCATSTLTQSESKQYADLSLVDFLETRFQDRQSVAVKNTVRYLAYFNDVNFIQLERPTVELRNFCQAGAGKMLRTQAHTGNPLGKFFSTPAGNALRGFLYSTSRGRPDLAQDVAVRTFLLTEFVNSYFEEAEAQRAYATVRDKGTFGTWECKYEQGERKPWRVDVLPIVYAPRRDPGNLLTNHRMIIEVTPYQQ